MYHSLELPIVRGHSLLTFRIVGIDQLTTPLTQITIISQSIKRELSELRATSEVVNPPSNSETVLKPVNIPGLPEGVTQEQRSSLKQARSSVTVEDAPKEYPLNVGTALPPVNRKGKLV